MGMTSREFALLGRAGIVYRRRRDTAKTLPDQYGRYRLVADIRRFHAGDALPSLMSRYDREAGVHTLS
jgi:hypothetical protein